MSIAKLLQHRARSQSLLADDGDRQANRQTMGIRKTPMTPENQTRSSKSACPASITSLQLFPSNPQAIASIPAAQVPYITGRCKHDCVLTVVP